jgi:hypothetical protein
VLSRVSEVLASGVDLHVEHRALRADGAVIWISGSGRVVRGEDGTPTAIVGVAADVTATRRLADARTAAEAAAERNARRLHVLSAAGEVLGASLDVDATVQQLADLVVREYLADWCAVDLVAEAGRVTMLAVAHRDPEQVAFARRLREQYPPGDVADRPAYTTGEPEHYAEIPDAMLVAAAHDDEHLALMRQLDMGSAVVAPLLAGGRVIGTLTLVLGARARRYDESDVVLASELARRAATAIDNARLYAERDRAARTLQASLLPPSMPTVPGLELSARYRPAGEGLAIGGDFYDVFPVDEHTWCLVIGDVCGKGAEAAAMTSAARYSLRAAVIRERDPGLAIGVLNESLLSDDWHGRFCTVAVVFLTHRGDQVSAAIASGGHPPPLLRRADGRVEAPAVEGMLVGLLEHPPPPTRTMSLAPGDALLLYTDGVTEARRERELFAENRLHARVLGRRRDGARPGGRRARRRRRLRSRRPRRRHRPRRRPRLALTAAPPPGRAARAARCPSEVAARCPSEVAEPRAA